jgi:NCAIR mutase (PurE)-related protein
MTQPQAIEALLKAVATGKISTATAMEQLKYLEFEPVGDFAKIDNHREIRTGFPEFIWGLGKTSEQIVQIMNAMRRNSPIVVATRVEQVAYEAIKVRIPDVQYYPLPRLCALGCPPDAQRSGKIGVVTAGTADLAVAQEAALIAEFCGFEVQRLWDVGVAGIQRLLRHRELLHQADVLIVVAGMEGALPSVVAGLVDVPVIAVPTSIGYGASFGGIAPLLTMLNSCAAGIGVVNIDNGFGAAILAGQILRTGERLATGD